MTKVSAELDPATLGGLPVRSLHPGQWLAQPLRHAHSKAILLPAGTFLTRELIDKIRAMGLEARAVFCLGSGPAPRFSNEADLAAHYKRQRTSAERVAEAFGAMRDFSFVLFCLCAAMAFAFSSEVFALLGGVMLVAMLVNAWLSLQVLQKLSSLNRMFAGVPLTHARAS